MRLARILSSSLYACLGFAGTASATHAQTNSARDSDGSWSEPAVWLGGVPTGSSEVLVNTSSLTVEADAPYLTLVQEGGSIQVLSGVTLGQGATSTVIDGGFMNNRGTARTGNLTIQNNGDLTTREGATLVAGQMSMRRGFLLIMGNATASSFVTEDTGSATVRSSVTIGGTLTTTGGSVNLGNTSGSNFLVDVAGGTWSARPLAGIFSIGASNGGTFTVRDGGALIVADSASALGVGDGLIRLAEDFDGAATRDSLLLIGSSTLSAAPGTVKAAEVNGASSRAVVRFRHNASDFTFATPLTGSLRVEQEAGTTILSAVNTYSGATSVTGGQFIVNGSAANSVFALAGGMLGGAGEVGALTFTSGILAPGNSPGTLTAASLTWRGGAMQFELGADAASSDRLVIDGAFTRDGGTEFHFNLLDGSSAPSLGMTYILLTFASSTGFSTDDFSYTYLGAYAEFAGDFALGAESLTFTVTAIPEPGTATLLAGALALGVSAIRRRRSRAG